MRKNFFFVEQAILVVAGAWPIAVYPLFEDFAKSHSQGIMIIASCGYFLSLLWLFSQIKHEREECASAENRLLAEQTQHAATKIALQEAYQTIHQLNSKDDYVITETVLQQTTTTRCIAIKIIWSTAGNPIEPKYVEIIDNNRNTNLELIDQRSHFTLRYQSTNGRYKYQINNTMAPSGIRSWLLILEVNTPLPLDLTITASSADRRCWGETNLVG